ncbi:MAG: ABC transporter permease, partial [Clostridium sp.]|uniref:ABC transporter permease n=1 Tax=Clostridium sp. TaxID=1506 RepID=UPI003F30FAA5
MKFLYYVKTSLKGLISTIVPTIAYFILFPLILSGVFFMMENISHNSDLKLKEVTVQVVDLDKSEMSKALIEFLKGENFKEFVNIKEEVEPSNMKAVESIKGENKLIINKGYEEGILESKKAESIKLQVTDLKNEHSLEAIKNILNVYHQNLYMEVSGGNRDEINKINSISVINENIL